jgi:diaminopimelate epimerase
MHAAGNDFVVIDALDMRPLSWPAVARDLSARHTGVGSDGLMLIDKSRVACCRASMFNPDGSEDFCADGILCVVAYLRKSGKAPGREFVLDTLWGPRRVRTGRESERAVEVTAEIGDAIYDPRKIPAHFTGDAILQRRIKVNGRTFTISAVSTGTPHAIIFTDKLPDDAEFFKWAPLIEQHPLFPEKTTVQWVVIDSPRKVRSRIWERGAVGESLACGTGACAVAAVGHRLGLLGRRVESISKGGKLTIHIDQSCRLWITGKAAITFQGKADLPSR